MEIKRHTVRNLSLYDRHQEIIDRATHHFGTADRAHNFSPTVQRIIEEWDLLRTAEHAAPSARIPAVIEAAAITRASRRGLLTEEEAEKLYDSAPRCARHQVFVADSICAACIEERATARLLADIAAFDDEEPAP